MYLAKLSKISIYVALISPLIVSRELFFPFITGKALFFRTFVEIALFFSALGIAYGEIPIKRVKDVIKDRIFIIFSIFTGLIWLTAYTAERPAYAIWSNFERGEGAWQMLHYFIFFALISLIFRTKNDWKGLAIVQTIGGSLVALYAAAQGLINAIVRANGVESAEKLTKWIISPNMAALSGTLGNPSYLGGYLMISMLFAIYIVRTETKEIWRYIWCGALLLQGIMFFTAKTRGSFVAGGVGILILLFVWAFQRKKGALHNALLLACGVAITGATTLLVLTVKEDAIRSMQPRLWTWNSAVSGIIERPLVGWGTENFPFIFDKYYNQNHYGIQSWFDRAHNAIIEYATGGGLPLAIAYLGIFMALYMKIWRKERSGWRPLFLAMPAAYLINGLVLFEILPLYITLCLMIAFLSRHADGFAEGESDMHGKNRNMGALAGAAAIAGPLIAISLYATAYAPLRKNLLMTEALRTNGKTDDQVFREYDAALAYESPVGTEEAVQNLYSFTVGYFEYLRGNDLFGKVGGEKIERIMANNKKWHDLVGPKDIGLKGEYAYITSLVAVGQITGKRQYISEAKELMKIAEGAAPTRPELVRVRMAIAALERDAAEYAKARKKGVMLRPDIEWEETIAEFKY